MAQVNKIGQSKKLPNAPITAINPIVSATVSQYLPTCDGRFLILANSPSIASITPLIISKKQARIISPCEISQSQKIVRTKCRFVTCITDTGFSFRYRAITLANGLPHSDKSMTFLSPYFFASTSTPVSI